MPPRIGPKTPSHVYFQQWREWCGLSLEQLGGRFEPPISKSSVWRMEESARLNEVGKITKDVVAAYAEALGRKPVEMYEMPPEKGEQEIPSLDKAAAKADLDSSAREHFLGLISAYGARKRG